MSAESSRSSMPEVRPCPKRTCDGELTLVDPTDDSWSLNPEDYDDDAEVWLCTDCGWNEEADPDEALEEQYEGLRSELELSSQEIDHRDDEILALKEQLEATQRILTEERRWYGETRELLATFAERGEEVKRALTASGVRPDLRDDLISLLAQYVECYPASASEPVEATQGPSTDGNPSSHPGSETPDPAIRPLARSVLHEEPEPGPASEPDLRSVYCRHCHKTHAVAIGEEECSPGAWIEGGEPWPTDQSPASRQEES